MSNDWGSGSGSPAAGRGFEALGRGPGLRGPGEPPDGHDHANDHLALVYEDATEQFDAAAPFVRQGLDEGERCVYVADRNDEDEVLAALQSRGVDIDDALESGALTIETPADTYHRMGEFDRDAMLAFWEETLADARANGFTGVRATAEMTWVLGDDGTAFDDLTEYEALLNPLYEDDDYVVMCQYDRDEFPADVLTEVVETHPHLVNEGTVCRNFYYTPPAEYFGPDRPDRQLDRMLGSLRERTAAKSELREHTEYLRELYEITADSDCSFEETVERLLELGCERFGLRGGALAHLPSWDDNFRAEVTVGPELDGVDGVLPIQPEPGSFCREAIMWDEPTAVPDVSEAGWDDDPVFEEFGLATYFGIRVSAGADPYGTFWFYDTEPREEPFTDEERTFLELMGQWVSNELERTERNRTQRELYEIAADPDRDFDAKLTAMFDLGCERFDLDLGGLARIDPATDYLEIEAVSGDHDHLKPGAEVALSETYCRMLADGQATAGVTDPTGSGFDGTRALEEFGVQSYLGTRIELGCCADRTFFFVSTDPRAEPFSEAERTFLHLMGQWVKYELERRNHRDELEETVERLRQSNDRLKQFAYAASHDLQEPLRMIASYLQLLENRYADELDEEAREYVDFAVDGAKRMRAMVDDLLAFSRVEHAEGDPEPVDCDVLLERVTDDLAVRIDERDADVVVDSLPTVSGDAEQIEQLFRNLVSNAVKYGGDDPTVTVRADRRGDRWAFTVDDDGIGIDPAQTDRIFEVFTRLHHEDEYSGTGIGLALCQEIVDNHGGDIAVDSEPGEGTAFTFTLPATDER